MNSITTAPPNPVSQDAAAIIKRLRTALVEKDRQMHALQLSMDAQADELHQTRLKLATAQRQLTIASTTAAAVPKSGDDLGTQWTRPPSPMSSQQNQIDSQKEAALDGMSHWIHTSIVVMRSHEHVLETVYDEGFAWIRLQRQEAEARRRITISLAANRMVPPPKTSLSSQPTHPKSAPTTDPDHKALHENFEASQQQLSIALQMLQATRLERDVLAADVTLLKSDSSRKVVTTGQPHRPAPLPPMRTSSPKVTAAGVTRSTTTPTRTDSYPIRQLRPAMASEATDASFAQLAKVRDSTNDTANRTSVNQVRASSSHSRTITPGVLRAPTASRTVSPLASKDGTIRERRLLATVEALAEALENQTKRRTSVNKALPLAPHNRSNSATKRLYHDASIAIAVPRPT